MFRKKSIALLKLFSKYCSATTTKAPQGTTCITHIDIQVPQRREVRDVDFKSFVGFSNKKCFAKYSVVYPGHCIPKVERIWPSIVVKIDAEKRRGCRGCWKCGNVWKKQRCKVNETRVEWGVLSTMYLSISAVLFHLSVCLRDNFILCWIPQSEISWFRVENSRHIFVLHTKMPFCDIFFL